MTAPLVTVEVEQRIGDVVVEVEGETAATVGAVGGAITVVVEQVGLRGPSGAGVGSFEHVQSSESALWIVNHNLGRKPAAVSVRSVGGIEVIAGVVHASENQLHVMFAVPTVGSVLVQ